MNITTRVRAAMEAKNASTAMVAADKGKELKKQTRSFMPVL